MPPPPAHQFSSPGEPPSGHRAGGGDSDSIASDAVAQQAKETRKLAAGQPLSAVAEQQHYQHQPLQDPYAHLHQQQHDPYQGSVPQVQSSFNAYGAEQFQKYGSGSQAGSHQAPSHGQPSADNHAAAQFNAAVHGSAPGQQPGQYGQQQQWQPQPQQQQQQGAHYMPQQQPEKGKRGMMHALKKKMNKLGFGKVGSQLGFSVLFRCNHASLCVRQSLLCSCCVLSAVLCNGRHHTYQCQSFPQAVSCSLRVDHVLMLCSRSTT